MIKIRKKFTDPAMAVTLCQGNGFRKKLGELVAGVFAQHLKIRNSRLGLS